MEYELIKTMEKHDEVYCGFMWSMILENPLTLSLELHHEISQFISHGNSIKTIMKSITRSKTTSLDVDFKT